MLNTLRNHLALAFYVLAHLFALIGFGVAKVGALFALPFHAVALMFSAASAAIDGDGE